MSEVIQNHHSEVDQSVQKKDRLRDLLETDEVRSWRSIMGAFKKILAPLEEGLSKEGWGLSRFEILFQLYFEGPMPAVEIAKRLLVTRGNISTFLKRLQKDELVRAVPIVAGGKRVEFTLTPKGKKIFEKIFPRHIQRVKQHCPPLDAKTIRSLHQISAMHPPLTPH